MENRVGADLYTGPGISKRDLVVVGLVGAEKSLSRQAAAQVPTIEQLALLWLCGLLSLRHYQHIELVVYDSLGGGSIAVYICIS